MKMQVFKLRGPHLTTGMVYLFIHFLQVTG